MIKTHNISESCILPMSKMTIPFSDRDLLKMQQQGNKKPNMFEHFCKISVSHFHNTEHSHNTKKKLINISGLNAIYYHRSTRAKRDKRQTSMWNLLWWRTLLVEIWLVYRTKVEAIEVNQKAFKYQHERSITTDSITNATPVVKRHCSHHRYCALTGRLDSKEDVNQVSIISY